MAEIWFIRHGESLANAGERTLISKTMGLSPKGIDQAVMIAPLFDQPPDLIIMSPYTRTQMTAAPTIARFPSAAQEIWPIQEISYLDVQKFTNTTPEERRPAAEAYWTRQDVNYDDGEGAESFNQFLSRVRDMIDRLEKSPQKRIAVFGHGLFFHAMEMLVQNPQMPAQEIMKKIGEIRVSSQHMPNGHIIRAHTENEKMSLGAKPPESTPVKTSRQRQASPQRLG